ncbi:hypothetical protein AB0J52_12805 [Spirillospora sp. NPDC049652]
MNRPTFLPPDDKPETPVLPTTPTPPGPSAPLWKRRRWIAGAGALLLAAGGVAWAVAGSGSGEKKERAAFASAPDMCAAVSQGTLDRLVPKAQKPPTTGTYPDQRYTYCDWRSSTIGEPGVKRIVERGVMVAVRLSANDSAARLDFESEWRGALRIGGTTSLGTLHSDATARISGIGDQAFFTHRTATSGLGKIGTAEETVRVRNAVVTVSYRGRDSRADRFGWADQKTTLPLDATTGRPPADALAQEVVTALTSCAPCRARS